MRKLYTLILLACLSVNVFPQVNEQDSLALVALYQSTDGTNWTNNNNWLTGTVDTWHGITVIGDRVTKIEFQNRIFGPLTNELNSPDEGHRWNIGDLPTFQWSSPNDGFDGVVRSFELKIVKMLVGQTKEKAMEENDAFFTYLAPESTINYDRSYQLSSNVFDPDFRYAWQVTANYPDLGLVGDSEIRTFLSHNSVSYFFASNINVTVDSLVNNDPNNLSGFGSTRLSSGSDPVSFEFENLEVLNTTTSSINTLASGEVIIETTPISLPLTPQMASDEEIFYELTNYRINPEGLYVNGQLSLSTPLNTSLSNGSKVINIGSTWLNYNNYTINGSIPLNENMVFDNILNFKFIPGNSYLSIFNNTYDYVFSGDILIPDSLVHGSDSVKFPISEINSFELLTVNSNDVRLKVADSTNIFIYPQIVSFDFSNTISTDKFQNEPEWTGVYFDSFNLLTENKLDTIKNNISTSNDLSFDSSDNLNNISYISSDEWFMDIDIIFTDSQPAEYQVYGALLDSMHLKHDINGFNSDSHLYGKISIPAISDDFLNFKIPFNNSAIGVGEVLNIDNKYEVLNAPFLNVPADVTAIGIMLNWYEDEQATQYSVTLSDDNFNSMLADYIDIPVENDTFLALDNLIANKDYSYRITSHFGDGSFLVSLTGNFKSLVTSVNIEEIFKLVIYPNPTHGLITLQLPDAPMASVTIMDLKGLAIKTVPNIIDEKTLQIDLGNLSAGTYSLLIETGQSKRVEKVIIIK